nr:hypothetical protein [uncultured Anaerocolumna sp.]
MKKRIEVVIHLNRLMDLEEVLSKIKKYKEENPHATFRIEVNY